MKNKVRLTLYIFLAGSMAGLWACSRPVSATPTQEVTALPSAAPSATPTARLEPTSTSVPPTVTPSPTPTSLPTIVVYEPISADNAGQLARIGEPHRGVLYNHFNDYVMTVFAPHWLRMLFRPDAIWVAEVQEWHKINVHIFKGGQVALFPNNDLKQIDQLAVSADGRFLAAASAGGRVLRLWDMDSLEQVSELPLSGYERVTAGGFSSDNRYLALGGCTLFGSGEVCLRSKVVVYDLDTGEVFEELQGRQTQTRDLVFLPDSYLLAIAGWGEPIRETGLLVRDLEKHQRAAEFSGKGHDWYDDVAVSSDGRVLVGGREGTNFWDIQTWERFGTVWESSSRGLAFIPGTYIAVFADASQDLFVIDATPPDLSYLVGYQGAGLKTGIQYIANIFPGPDGRFLYIHDSGRGLVEKWGVPVVVTATPGP